MTSIFNFIRENMPEGKHNEKAIRRLYEDLFDGPNGRLVLAHIIGAAMVNKPPFVPRAHSGDRATTPLDLAYQRGMEDLAKAIAERAGISSADLSRAIATDNL